MIASLLRLPPFRQHAVIADPDTAARRLIVTVLLLAIALDQSCCPAMAAAVGAAAEAAAATLTVFFKLPVQLSGILVGLASAVIAHRASGSIDSRSYADLRLAPAALVLTTDASAASLYSSDAAAVSPNAAGTAA